MNDRTALYRLFDAGGALLYVGVSTNPEVRWMTHASTQRWWPDVAEKAVAWFDNRPDALRAEASAIEQEHPRYNKAGAANWYADLKAARAAAAVPAAAFTIRISDELRYRIKAAAAEDKRSLNGEIEWLLETMLAARDTMKPLGRAGQ